MNLRFLRDSTYGPHRALAAAVITLVASIVVLLLPPSWGILGGQFGLILALALVLIAAFRYRRQRYRT